jgi:hypothetical protein
VVGPDRFKAQHTLNDLGLGIEVLQYHHLAQLGNVDDVEP